MIPRAIIRARARSRVALSEVTIHARLPYLQQMRWLAWLGVAIVVGAGATAAALTWGHDAHAGNPAAIRTGMTMQEARKVAGSPDRATVEHLGEYERIRARDLTGRVVRTEECWFYNVTKENTVNGACFFKGRVLDALVYQHG